jgi:SAM-dependent methyltransferase
VTGEPVEVYAVLPPAGEPEIIDAAIPARSSILDLGCGTGRLAAPLAARGHTVLGVDASAEMLAHVEGVPTILARMEDLRLARRFDVVLLASHFVNAPDPADRRTVLDASRRHVRPTGQVVIERHAPEWFDGLSPGDRRHGEVGPVGVELHVLAVDGPLLTADVTYTVDGGRWTQRFTTRRLTDEELTGELHAAGLGPPVWLHAERHWFSTRPLN